VSRNQPIQGLAVKNYYRKSQFFEYIVIAMEDIEEVLQCLHYIRYFFSPATGHRSAEYKKPGCPSHPYPLKKAASNNTVASALIKYYLLYPSTEPYQPALKAVHFYQPVRPGHTLMALIPSLLSCFHVTAPQPSRNAVFYPCGQCSVFHRPFPLSSGYPLPP